MELFRDEHGVLRSAVRPTTYLKTHPETPECHIHGCVIHSPSASHMSDWPMNWREDRGIMERICKHGVGHPDVDQADFNTRTNREYENEHGCCGCCNPETPNGFQSA